MGGPILASSPGRPSRSAATVYGRRGDTAVTGSGRGAQGVPSERSTLVFGEKLLSLLDTGSFTTSYKYALLLALLDAVLENTEPSGEPPQTLSGRALGRRVLELYWDQARPFSEQGPLRQSASRDLVVKIAEARSELDLPEHVGIDAARLRHGSVIENLERTVIATVVRYPIPLLQRFGTGTGAIEDRFIYDYGWQEGVSEGRVFRADFDDRLHLADGAGEHLSALAGLVRPVVQREWMRHVARRNDDQLDELRLEAFLFGAARIDLSPVRGELLELQRGRCFYCHGERSGRGWEVDHFLPWSRWPDDRLDNLVVAHASCNGEKRAALAAVVHLDRWWGRLESGTSEHRRLGDIATRTSWPRRSESTAGAARALYLHQPEGAMLWRGPGEVEPLRHKELSAVITGTHIAAAADESGTWHATE